MTDPKTMPQSSEKIVKKRLSALKPFEKNSRTHSEDQIAQIVASIKEWGFTNPVLIDEGGLIIAGHGRVMAAQSLGLGTIPCIVAKGWSDAQKRAYVIADNRLAENAEWNYEILDLELHELGQIDFDVSLIGFDAAGEVINFTPEILPSMDGREVSETDLSAAADKLAAPMGQVQSRQHCVCPYCGEGFEFDGN